MCYWQGDVVAYCANPVIDHQSIDNYSINNFKVEWNRERKLPTTDQKWKTDIMTQDCLLSLSPFPPPPPTSSFLPLSIFFLIIEIKDRRNKNYNHLWHWLWRDSKKKKKMKVILAILSAIFLQSVRSSDPGHYEVPEPLFEVFSPKGLRILLAGTFFNSLILLKCIRWSHLL